MPKYFIDLKIVGVGPWGYANKFYGLEKMLVGGGLCQQILCMDFKKKFGGGWLCPNIFLT